jgi:hypothetical protein
MVLRKKPRISLLPWRAHLIEEEGEEKVAAPRSAPRVSGSAGPEEIFLLFSINPPFLNLTTPFEPFELSQTARARCGEGRAWGGALGHMTASKSMTRMRTPSACWPGGGGARREAQVTPPFQSATAAEDMAMGERSAARGQDQKIRR